MTLAQRSWWAGQCWLQARICRLENLQSQEWRRRTGGGGRQLTPSGPDDLLGLALVEGQTMQIKGRLFADVGIIVPVCTSDSHCLTYRHWNDLRKNVTRRKKESRALSKHCLDSVWFLLWNIHLEMNLTSEVHRRRRRRGRKWCIGIISTLV